MKGPTILTPRIRLRFATMLLALLMALTGTSPTRARSSEQHESILHHNPSQAARDDRFEFRRVEPGRSFQFPQDHAAHPGYRIEWWYLTANLKDKQHRDWGLQWTLFRTSLGDESAVLSWESPVIWMAHAALSPPLDVSALPGHQFEQRFARGGIGQAGVSSPADIAALGFEAWLDDWLFKSDQSMALFPASLHFTVGETQLKFQLRATGPIVLQGQSGYSRKSADGQASYYYSHPNLAIQGEVAVKNAVFELEGLAWLDREWSSAFLAPDQAGWDWFALHLEDGRKLMVYRLRNTQGKDHLSGSLVESTGEVQQLDGHDIQLTALRTTTLSNGIVLPLHWRLELPGKQLGWTVSTENPEQFMETAVPYWEGRVDAKPLSEGPGGIGYMELTGYDAVD
ncbi:lipocalin-like domain-containing protein [Allohahella sp. A8]|uniref:lipocalin-like domain-containing protein n=1 Tax=Allohahella sp. A8 TaxID=3141461 RepID=UPI003A801D85